MLRTKYRISLPLSLLVMLTLLGCAQQPSEEAEAALPEEDTTTQQAVEESGDALDAREAALAEREQQVARREADVTRRETTTAPEPVQPTPPVLSLVVPSATALDVEFLDGLSSEESTVGERFLTRVVNDVFVDDRIAIPAGSEVSGAVVEVQPSKKIGGQASLTLKFDRLSLPDGESTLFEANLAQSGKKQTKKDAATIGGSAAGGAILGRVLDKKHSDKATVLGAVVGAAVGTAIAANNPGDPVEIEAGSVVALTLEQPLTVVIEGEKRRFAD